MAKNNAVWIVVGIFIVLVVALNWNSLNGLLKTNSFSGLPPSCGNGICELSESCSGCPADCGACNCITGQQDYADCGNSFSYKWPLRQCIDSQWVDVPNVNPCYCTDNSYCSSGYTCVNHICTQYIPTFCANTGQCNISGFYCTENHTCSKCPYTYSLFSVKDCEFSQFSCQSSSDCYNLAQDYCTKWKCQNNRCDADGLRYEGCCTTDANCGENQTCTSKSCAEIPAVVKAKPSATNVIITVLIIGALIAGVILLYKFKDKIFGG